MTGKHLDCFVASLLAMNSNARAQPSHIRLGVTP
jgi:hypothetical protein